MTGVPLRISLLVLLGLIALPVLAILVGQYTEDRRGRHENLSVQAHHLADLVAAHQSAVFEGTRSVLEAASRLEALQTLDTAECNRRLADIHQVMSDLMGLGATTASGAPFCSSTGVVGDPINLADRDYFQQALQTGQMTISNITIGRRLRTATVILAQPVVSPGGKPVAVIIASLALNRLSANLGRLSLPAGGVVFLRDSADRVIAAWPASDNPAWDGLDLEHASPGFFDQPADQSRFVFASAPLNIAPHLTATVGLPAVHADAAATAFYRQVLLVCAVFAIAALAVYLLSELWIRRPLVKLGEAAGALAAGDLSARVDPRAARSAEGAFLATSFNHMADAVEKHQKEVLSTAKVLRKSSDLNRELAAIVEVSEDAILRTTLDGVITTWNAGAERLFGHIAEEAVGTNVSRLVPPDRREERQATIKRIVAGEQVDHFETERLRRDGQRIPVSVGYSLIRNETGRPVAIAAMARDISRGKQFEAALADRAAKQRALADLGRHAIAAADVREVLFEAVRSVREELAADRVAVWRKRAGDSELEMLAAAGWPPRDGPYREIPASPAGLALERGTTVVTDHIGTAEHAAPDSLVVRSGMVSSLDVPIGAEGALGVLSVCCREARQFGPHDLHFIENVAHILATAITRDESQRQETLLLRELSHRVKNILALVISLARQTAKSSDDFAQFYDKFQDRILSLSAAHDLLMQTSWRGALLPQLAETILAPHLSGAEGRVSIALQDVLLQPGFAQSLALMLHELATNAVKYGALSTNEGRLELTSGTGPSQLVLRWREFGVDMPRQPVSEGFGMQFLKRALHHQYNGAVAIEWLPGGLSCTIRVDLRHALHAMDEKAS